MMENIKVYITQYSDDLTLKKTGRISFDAANDEQAREQAIMFRSPGERLKLERKDGGNIENPYWQEDVGWLDAEIPF